MNEPTSTTSTAAPSSLRDDAQQLAGEGRERAANVASEAGEHAKAVVGQAGDHARELFGRARDDVQHQARDRAGQAAGSLRSLADQLGALSSGDTSSAGPLVGYLDDAKERVAGLASRLDDGPEAVLDDLRSFARRRPMAFLGAAGVLGFVAGRLVRASTGGHDDGGDHGDRVAARYGAGAERTPTIAPLDPALDPELDPPNGDLTMPPLTTPSSTTVGRTGGVLDERGPLS